MPGTHRSLRAASRTGFAALVLGLLTLLPEAQAAHAAHAAPSPWSATAVRPSASRPRTVTPTVYRSYLLDADALSAQLAASPDRVRIPDPDGNLVEFTLVDDPVMEPALAAAHPELRTWAGQQVGGPGSLRLDLTPEGLHASVIGDGPSWYVDPAYRDAGSGASPDGLYVVYRGGALPAPEQPFVEPKLDASRVLHRAAPGLEEGPGQLVQLHTYRLALLSDPTFASYVAPSATNHAQSDPAVLAAKVTLVNRLDQIYVADLSVKLVLADNTDTKLNLRTGAEATGADGPCGLSACFTSAMLSPTGAGCSNELLDRVHWVIGQLLGARNYDVGHLSLAINSGGLAGIGVVGSPLKGEGCTGLTAPSGDAYAVDYMAHELGHQFGADHTFDGTAGGCGGGNRYQPTAIEPGSGSSVMAYAGICGSDDLQAHSDPYFAGVSRDEIAGTVTQDPFPVEEVQSVALDGFDAADAFTLTVGAATTAPITRGTSYSVAGITSALLAVLPAGSVITVQPFFDDGSFDERGFTVSYTFYGSTFYGNVPEPVVTKTAGTFTSAVNDIDAGNPGATALGTVTSTANHNPTVTLPAARTIPTRTPFALTGSATDADGNPLGYVWEQDDAGDSDGQLLTDQPKTSGPLFRIFGTASSTFTNAPGSTPTRVFPDLAQVLAGDTDAKTGTCPGGSSDVDCLSEWLPTSAYAPSTLDFRLTALDQATVGGGTDSADVALTVDKTAGPFLVTSQADGSTLGGGSTQTVAWAVNGTNTAALAPNVKITLSTDGGTTWGTVLAASTPNDGSQPVTLPDADVAAARIKVEAVGNYFFSVNPAPFAIQGSGSVAPLVVDHSAVPAGVAVQYADPVGLSFGASTGQGSATLSASATGLPAGVVLSAPTVLSPDAASWAVSGAPVVAPGSYPVQVTVADQVATSTFAFTVVVSAEDATVTFSSPTSVVGDDPDADTVPVTASAAVTQAPDGSLGPIDTATVTFTDTSTGTTLCAAAPVTPSGTGPGTATCQFDADLSADDSVTYHLALAVGGDYTGHSASDTTLTVALPDPGTGDAPDTTILSGPLGWLLGATTSIAFTSSEPAATFVCRLDGAPLSCNGSSVVLRGLTAQAHHFTVAAQDADDVRDATPAVRDFAVPLDDPALTATVGRWKRKHTGSAYDGTYSQAAHRGATLTYRVTGARELALVVGTGKRFGKVKVYLDDTLLSTVSLKGGAGYRKAVSLASFPAPRSGTVRIVTASGKRVRIDGLGVSTLAF